MFWIRIVNRHVILVHLASSAIVVLALLAVTSWANITVDDDGPIGALLTAIFTGLLALAVPLLGTIAALQRPLRSVLRIVGQASSGGTPILPFLGDTLDGMNRNLLELRGDGATLENYEVAAWVRRCFKAASGQYVGTDSHLPSFYTELYSDYLAAHKEYLTKTKLKDSVRVMLVESERLRSDRTDRDDAFNDFMKWHAKEPVDLLHLPPRENDNTLSADSPLVNSDVGFWRDNFVLLFSRVSEGEEAAEAKVKLRLAFAGEPLYDMSSTYIDALLKTAGYQTPTPRDLKDELPIYTEALSQHWRQFCDPPERLERTGPFLESVLGRFGDRPDRIRVFDAATGIGIEAVHLLKKGYYLIANEIEPSLREDAQHYAHELGTTIPEAHFTKLDWLRLRDGLPEGSYDAVYVIGNSLCHLESDEQVERALQQFHEILVPGGVLICDERNFDYITRNWEHIKDDPWNNFRFNTRTEKVMYHGVNVMGAPVDRKKKRVIFQYADVSRDGTKIVPGKVAGELGMLSFPKGSLKKKLAAQFSKVEVYCDLEASPDGQLSDDADFFTYVATK